MSAGATGKAVSFETAPIDPPPLAFLGVRACELAALGIQDRVFLGGPYTDEDYRARRRSALIIAVNCTTSVSTCFCTSMGTGPEVRGGYDLALTELDEGFIIRAGSPEGADLVARLPVRGADAGQMFRAAEAVGKVAATIGDPVPTAGLHDRLLAQFDSPSGHGSPSAACPARTARWSARPASAARSSSAPTSTAASPPPSGCGTSASRPGFAKVAGGSFRSRPRDRYRQWLTHKFATWVDQFGTFGCVGCGRCIAWCPVGHRRPRGAARRSRRRSRRGRSRPAPHPVAATPGSYATARIVARPAGDPRRHHAHPRAAWTRRSSPGSSASSRWSRFRPSRRSRSPSRASAGTPSTSPSVPRAPRPRRSSAWARATRSACAGRSAPPGRSSARWATTWSSSPAASGWRRCGR